MQRSVATSNKVLLFNGSVIHTKASFHGFLHQGCSKRLTHSRQKDSKPVSTVGPAVLWAKTAARKYFLRHLATEFVAILSMDALSLLQLDLHSDAGYPNGLPSQAFNVDLHARSGRIPLRDMSKGAQIKIGA